MIERTARLGIKDLVISVLSLIVVLELMRAFVEYFEHHRVRMEILLEVLIAFGIREFMILIFQGKLDGVDVLYWTAGLFMLVLGRTLTIIVKPGGGKIPLQKKHLNPLEERSKMFLKKLAKNKCFFGLFFFSLILIFISFGIGPTSSINEKKDPDYGDILIIGTIADASILVPNACN